MIKKNVFFVNFNPLYEIFEEIKENLPFDIIKHESEDSFIIDKNFDNKLNVAKKLDDRNILNIQDHPILIIKLIELINIQLIKLRFNYQSKININDYELNLNSKIFSKDNLILKLTEKEIEIILYLINNKKKHTVFDLQQNIWGYAANMETHTVETHVYRLRKKISDKFNEDSFILSHPAGYYIELNSD